MKPTSEQTRKGVLSAVPFVPEDLLKMRSFNQYNPTDSSEAVAVPQSAAIDPSTAYGCVDWYLYPDAKTTAHV
jgi:hypothetical protein